MILSEGNELLPVDFMLETNAAQDMRETTSLNLEEIEEMTIRKALVKHHGNISKAAEELGITRPALYRRIDKYGL